MSTSTYEPTPEDAAEELTVLGQNIETGSRFPLGRSTANYVEISVFGGICMYQSGSIVHAADALRIVQVDLAVQGTVSLGQQLLNQIDAVMGAVAVAAQELELLGTKVREAAQNYSQTNRDVANLFHLPASYPAAVNYFSDAQDFNNSWPNKIRRAVTAPRRWARRQFRRAVIETASLVWEDLRDLVDVVVEDLRLQPDIEHIYKIILPYIAWQAVNLGEDAFDSGLTMAVVRELAAAFGYERNQRGVRDFSLLLGSVLSRDDEVSVRQIAPPNTNPALGVDTVHRKASDSLEELVAPYHEISGLEEAVVRIDRIVNAAGEVEWQVIIPGTNGGVLEGEKPWNWRDATPAVAGLPTPGMAGIMMAMRQAGIKPNEKVVLVGHSQGGALAVNVANRAAASGEFNVKGILTLGSPVSNLPVPDQTHLLALEHGEDAVTSLDGGPNRAALNSITASRPLKSANNPETAAGSGLEHAHNYHTYIETAAMVDQSDHELLQYSKEQLLGSVGPGSYATSMYFEVSVDK